MAGTDVVYFYRDEITGEEYWGVRDLRDAWRAAGSPPINSAGRLYAVQLQARLAYERGYGSPADDPRRPDAYVLAHVRFGAADIDPTPARVAALSAAGLVRPYVYEPWHWQLPNIYSYPLIHAVPAGDDAGDLLLEMSDEMIAIKSPNRQPTALDGNGYTNLTQEEFDNFPGPKHTVNDRQFDLATSVYSRLNPWIDPRESFVGKGGSDNRPWTLFAPGYVKVLTQEEVDNNPFTSRRVTGNDRQYDLWIAEALQGATPDK